MRRRTIAESLEVEGVGIHTGERASVRLDPLPFGAGLRFRVDAVDIPVDLRWATSEPGSTLLQRDGARVRTPEHLLSALMGLGITDLRATLVGPEVPILDGSALVWCERLLDAGIAEGPPLVPLVLAERVAVEGHFGQASAWPAPNRIVSVEVHYDSPLLPQGRARVDLGEDSYVRQVAPARTYVLERDVTRVRAAGRGKGATTQNTVLWGDAGPLTPLRMPHEVPSHKLLDLVGDLALLGAPLVGRVHVSRGSHALHQALVSAIRASLRPPATVG